MSEANKSEQKVPPGEWVATPEGDQGPCECGAKRVMLHGYSWCERTGSDVCMGGWLPIRSPSATQSCCGQVSYLRFGLILRTSRGWPSDKRLFTTVGSSA